ncbi:MAG: AAA family ATPase [Psychrobacillus sp.]
MNIPITTVTSQRADTSSFTNDQKIAYKELIDFIDKPFDKTDYKRALVGAAGTGKTYLVKALILNSSISYSLIGLAAPTHKACRVLGESIKVNNIKVSTIQSDLGLRLNFDIEKFDPHNPPFDPKGKIKIGNYKLYIVDEASMINRGLCAFLEKTCISNKCKIIYIGDASQLAPVGEKYSSAFKGVKTYALKQIVRQGDDNPVSNLLEILRYDIAHKSYEFLKHIQRFRSKFNDDYTKGYQVCSPQEFNEIVYNNFNDEALTVNVDYAKVIAYTNAAVSSWNKYIRNSIIADADKSIITKNDLIISYTTIVNQFNECIIKNSEEYIIKDIVNYVDSKYQLRGFMIRFQAIHGGDITTPLFVLDHSDIYTIQKYMQISESMINAAKTTRSTLKAQKWREYFAFKESYLLLTNILGSDGKIKVGRDLDYGFSLTSHKSQGSTFDTSLVDVNDIVYDKFGQPYADAEEVNRRLYVACSRCKNKLYLKFGK